MGDQFWFLEMRTRSGTGDVKLSERIFQLTQETYESYPLSDFIPLEISFPRNREPED